MTVIIKQEVVWGHWYRRRPTDDWHFIQSPAAGPRAGYIGASQDAEDFLESCTGGEAFVVRRIVTTTTEEEKIPLWSGYIGAAPDTGGED